MPIRVNDSYCYPKGILDTPRSAAFEAFLRNYVHSTVGLSRREVDLAFLAALLPEERSLAREFLRANLGTRHPHILKGVADLQDAASVPILRSMLIAEAEPSMRLVIAGSLWRLDGDQIFPVLLEEMIRSGDCELIAGHEHDILWLADMRAITLMIRILTLKCDSLRGGARGARTSTPRERLGSLVPDIALRTLCAIEDCRLLTASQVPPRDVTAYTLREHDFGFMSMMVQHLREWYLPSVCPEILVRS